MGAIGRRSVLFLGIAGTLAVVLVFGVAFLCASARQRDKVSLSDRVTLAGSEGAPIYAPVSISSTRLRTGVFEIEEGAYYVDEGSDIVFIESSGFAGEGESGLTWSGRGHIPSGAIEIVGAGPDWIAVSESPRHRTLTLVSLKDDGEAESSVVNLGPSTYFYEMACAPFEDVLLIVWTEERGSFARLVARDTLETQIEIELQHIGTSKLLRVSADLMLSSSDGSLAVVLALTPNDIEVKRSVGDNWGHGLASDDLFATFIWSDSVRFHNRYDGSFIRQMKLRDHYLTHVRSIAGDCLYVSTGPISRLNSRGWITCFLIDGKRVTREFTIRLDNAAWYVDASADGSVLILQAYDSSVYKLDIDHQNRTYELSRIHNLPLVPIRYSYVDNDEARLYFASSRVQVVFDN